MSEVRESAEDDEAVRRRAEDPIDGGESNVLWDRYAARDLAPDEQAVEELKTASLEPVEEGALQADEPLVELSPDEPAPERLEAPGTAETSHLNDGVEFRLADEAQSSKVEISPIRRASEDAAERDLGLDEVPITDLTIETSGHQGDVYRVELLDDRLAYLKPQSEANVAERVGDAVPADGGWARELAAYDFDQMAGFGLVPETVNRSEPFLEMDRVSLQASAPLEALEVAQYTEQDRQRMAVLDYVLGNLDRHPRNYRTYADGGLAAIDHGTCLPEHDGVAIRSSFVAEWLSKDLRPDVLAETFSVSPQKFAGGLRARGISNSAIDGAISRLCEIQELGKIRGRAWRGEFEYFDSNKHLHLLRGRI